MKAVYPMTFTPFDNGQYMAQSYDIPSCITTGVGLADTVDMARDALNACLCVLEDDELVTTIPEPTAISSITAPEGSFVSLIDVDTVAHRKMTDNHAVKKTISLPQWMALRVDKMNLNLSQFIQGKLLEFFEPAHS